MTLPRIGASPALAYRRHRLERRVARREVQLARAYSTGDGRHIEARRKLQALRAGARNDGRYVKRRADKLERARGDLARVRADLAAVGRWEPEERAA